MSTENAFEFNEFGVSEVLMPRFHEDHIRMLFDKYDNETAFVIDARSATQVLTEKKAIVWSKPAYPKNYLRTDGFLQSYFVNDTSHLHGDDFFPLYNNRLQAVPKLLHAFSRYGISSSVFDTLMNPEFNKDIQAAKKFKINEFPPAEILSIALEASVDRVLYFRIATASSRYSIFYEIGHAFSSKLYFSANRVIFDNSTGKIIHKQWRHFYGKLIDIFSSIIASYDVLDICNLNGFYRSLSLLKNSYSPGNDTVLTELTGYDIEIDQELINDNRLQAINGRNRHQSTWTM